MAVPFTSSRFDLKRNPVMAVNGDNVGVRGHLSGIKPDRMPVEFNKALLDM